MSEKNRRRPRGYWTAEHCIQALDTFIENEGRRPKSAELGKAGLPSQAIFQNAVGCSYAQYCREHGYTAKPLPVWTKESITAATDCFFEQYGRYPKAEEYDLEHGLPSHNTFPAHFGITAGEYWKQRYPIAQEWTPETIKTAFEHFVEHHSRLPFMRELKPEYGLPSFSILLNRTGAATYSEFCRTQFPSIPLNRSIWDRESCTQAVDRFILQNGKAPTSSDCYNANGLPRFDIFYKKVGQTVLEYCKQKYPQLPGTPRRWTRESCLQAVDSFIAQNGRTPNYRDHKPGSGLPSPSTFLRAVGQTMDEYCGRSPQHNTVQTRWTKERCMQALHQFVVQNGRLPHSKEYRNANGLPNWITFERKVGETISAYCGRQYPELCQRVRWTPSKICAALDSFVERTGRPPLTTELSMENMLPSYTCFHRVTGMHPGEFIRQRYPEYYELPDRKQGMDLGMQMM